MPPPPRILRFGPFEADQASGELRKNGIRIRIHAQPFQLLAMLLERQGEIVTREEMRKQLWGEDTFVDFDHGLNSAMNKIRDALGDSPAKPRYVETISGKGYRFIAPVAAALPESAAETPPAPAEPVRASLLTTPGEVPRAPRSLVRALLLLIQAMYIAFYIGALSNLAEIHDIFLEADLPASPLMTLLVATAAALIPIRLYICTAAALDFAQLPEKFRKMFPALLVLDIAWALSPFLLIHHVPAGLALAMTAPLVYLPFAQRSLILMYAK